jgi:hypothetical protein
MNNFNIHTEADINNIEDVENLIVFFESIVGAGFHPDTPFTDYINTETGEPTFTPEQSDLYDTLLDKAFNVCSALGEDIYAIGLEELPEDPQDARNGIYSNNN